MPDTIPPLSGMEASWKEDHPWNGRTRPSGNLSSYTASYDSSCWAWEQLAVRQGRRRIMTVHRVGYKFVG
jgi:hypothetical protein